VTPKFIAPADPAARWTAVHRGPAFLKLHGYYLKWPVPFLLTAATLAFPCQITGRVVGVPCHSLIQAYKFMFHGTIGRHGSPWTPDTARSEAVRLLGEIVNGTDAAADERRVREAMTVAELCDAYLTGATAGRLLTRRGRPKSEHPRNLNPFARSNGLEGRSTEICMAVENIDAPPGRVGAYRLILAATKASRTPKPF
jgi:hypothetical protein